jgi:hypothetical protein
MIRHHPVDLSPHLNAVAATFDRDRAAGAVNAWGNSFPAEEMPFGGTLALDGVPFRLPEKRTGAGDHLEADGQIIEIPELPPVSELLLLGFGEMGARSLTLTVTRAGMPPLRCEVAMPGWLVRRDAPAVAGGQVFSHLHYPGGYELDLLRPALWLHRCRLHPAARLAALALGTDPLFHLMAVTLAAGSGGDD